MAKLSVSHICCSYQGKPIFDDLSFTIENDEILCLLGASGCGKTTALKAIAGLLPLEHGDIVIDGQAVNGERLFVPPEQRNIAMIFQDYALFPHLTVADNVGFAIRTMPKAQLQETVGELLALVKLEGLAQRYPHQLSGGQQQRVAIARALAYSPKLLLLDEPFSNIDPQVRHGLMDDIRQILKQRQMAAVFVTHSKEEGFAFADQMAVMNEGRIEQLDTPQQLYNHPQTPFVAEFLGKGVYLPATVLSPTRVETALGITQSSVALDRAMDSKGQLFVRPQYFTLTELRPTNAVIVHKSFVGSGFNYRVGFDNRLIDVFASADLKQDQAVHLTIDSHPLHLFDVDAKAIKK